MKLTVDPSRMEKFPETGIYYPAYYCDERDAYDLGQLDRASFLRVIRSQGNGNIFQENILLIVFGHKPIEDPEVNPKENPQ